jgi:hypothetical protein
MLRANRLEGLLLKLTGDHAGTPGHWFWRLFSPIRRDLDRMFWCFRDQPWMGAPSGFCEDDLVAFTEEFRTTVQLWRPGSLYRYADQFAEEAIELWAIEPTRDDPVRLARMLSASGWNQEIIRTHTRIWLIYTDSTSWEIYARKVALLDQVVRGLNGKRDVAAYQGRCESRGELFARAGLSEVWRALRGHIK